jgi:hypothetical protein
MNADQIWEEYARNRRLSGRAMLSLKAMLREAQDPYSAITLAGDTAAFQLAHEIATHLKSADPMVRWNATGVLFTRLRDVRSATLCLELLATEEDSMVLGIALRGAGELSPLIDDRELQGRLVLKLWRVFRGDESELPQVPPHVREWMREEAYRGIEAAVGIPPLDRAPANVELDMAKDVRGDVLADFHRTYGLELPEERGGIG